MKLRDADSTYKSTTVPGTIRQFQEPKFTKEKLGRCGEAWCCCYALFCGFERVVAFVDSLDG